MTRIAAVMLLLAQPAQAYLLLDGPMPLLGGARTTQVAKTASPAPRPNLDASAPLQPDSKGPVLKPGLINHTSAQGTSANGANSNAAFSDQLARRNRSTTNIGSTLAPAIVFSQPLE